MSAGQLNVIDVPDPATAIGMAAAARDKEGFGEVADYLDTVAAFLASVCGGAYLPDVRPGDEISVVRRTTYEVPS